MSLRIRQIVFAARELGPTRAQLQQLLAMDEPFPDPGVAEFGLHNAVFVFGDQFIEIVSPTREGTTCGRHLDRRGDSGYMVILQTDDFEREKSRFAELGVRLVWHKDLEDIRAMHLHPKDIGGAIVSIDQPMPPQSWRWGGPGWRVQAGDAGRQRVTGVTLEAADPQALAARWGQVLGLGVPQAHAGGWRLALEGGALDFIAAGPRGEGVAGYALAVVDPAAVAARAKSLGLAVDGLTVQLMGVSVRLEGLRADARSSA